jgi:hypothetical protein
MPRASGSPAADAFCSAFADAGDHISCAPKPTAALKIRRVQSYLTNALENSKRAVSLMGRTCAPKPIEAPSLTVRCAHADGRYITSPPTCAAVAHPLVFPRTAPALHTSIDQ